MSCRFEVMREVSTVTKPLQPEDRRRDKVEIDPEIVLDNAFCVYESMIDYEKKTVTVFSRECFVTLADYFGLGIADEAIAFEAYSWKWVLAHD
jgi:hypothetical protein